MLEEIKYAYALAKKLKAVKWEVICHETTDGDYKAFDAISDEFGAIWIASGPDYLRPSCYRSLRKLNGIDKLSWIAKRVIWYFGGFQAICDKHYIGKKDYNTLKLKKMLDNLK